MDQVDQQINEYIDNLVTDCVNSPPFMNLSPDRKQQMVESIRSHFYKIILESVVRALDETQFNQIENLDPSSQEMADKIQEFASTIPGLHKIIEEKLTKEVTGIKNSPTLS